MGRTKKAIWWIVGIVLTPLVLFATLVCLLYFPPVQNWAVRQAAAILSENTGMQVTVDRVLLKFPLDLALDRLTVIQPHDSIHAEPDTIADIRRLVADVQLWPLLDKKVVINQLEILDTRLNTNGFVDAAQVKGDFKRLFLRSRGIALDRQTVELNGALLEDARLDVLLRDSVPEDTTTTETLWVIRADSLSILRSALSLRMNGDSTQIDGRFGSFVARDILADLGTPAYRVGSIDWQDGGLRYNDIDMPQLALHTGAVSLVGDSLHVPSFHIKTPDSNLSLAVDFPLSFTDSLAPGKMQVQMDAQLGYNDLQPFLGDLPKAMLERWPRYPLGVSGKFRGNMDYMEFSGLDVTLPTALSAKADGYIANLNDLKRLRADVQFEVQGHDLGFVMAALPSSVRNDYCLPAGLRAEGRVAADGNRYAADVTLHDGNGRVSVDGTLDAGPMSYHVNADIRNLNVSHFMPHGPVHTVSANLSAKGCGTDLFSPSTVLDANAEIAHLGYDRWQLDNLTAHADVKNGRLMADVTSHNSLLDGQLGFGALMSKRQLDGTVTADIGRLDLYALGLVDNPLTIGLCGHVDVNSDMRVTHRVSGLLNDLTIRDSSKVYRPGDIGVLVKAYPDTTCLRIQSGDFIVKLDASDGYERLLRQCQTLADSVSGQISQRVIDQPAIRRLLPSVKLHIESKKDNPIATFIKSTQDMSFRDGFFDITTSPEKGINGKGYVYSLKMGETQLDTIMFRLTQRGEHLSFGGQVTNNKKNPDFVFNALLDGVLQQRGATLGVRLYDAAGKLGVRLGAQAEMVDSGISIHLVPERPTLGYKEFNLNKNNYILLASNNKIQASVDLIADDGTGLKVYSEGGDPTELQNLTLSVNRFKLDDLTAVVPYMPQMTGLLNGDYHLIQDAEGHISVAGDMAVQNLTYEHSMIGNMSTEVVYLYKGDDAHVVEARLLKDDVEIGLLSGTYSGKDEGDIDARFVMERLPLSMVNGFVDDMLFGLHGYGEGELTIKGRLSEPQVDGEIYLDSSYVESIPYGIKLRFDNDPVRIVASRLLLENFTVYAYNNNPLNIQGEVDFSHPDHMTTNLRMQARNFQIVGAKETAKSVVYGKAFINVFARMNGPVDNLYMRGRIDVLGSTDMSYVLQDSPLTTDNQLQELVKFTDFADTATVVVSRPSIDGFQMDMTIDVSKGSHITTYLNADHTNYIDVMGGGTLRMQYSPSDALQLRGRYTLSDGEMKYSLPIIPLKTFTIQDGSYIEFTGDVMNPTLNIKAAERTKAAVSRSGETGRSVDFDCGVYITKTLSDMGLEFTLDAPNDMQLHSELQAMSVEQRGKLAVTMLTTGMYLDEGNTSALSMNAALSSFLNSEINQITGNALRSLDVSFGMDNSADAAGNMHTDYTFKFAKRFMNNRLKITVGGLVSSGAELQERNNSFFDNVTLEYRLDDSANKFVTLFYQNNSYDWLDGYTQRYGGGFTWRRSLQTFWDIFRLRDTSPRNQLLLRGLQQQPSKTSNSPADSLKTKKDETK